MNQKPDDLLLHHIAQGAADLTPEEPEDLASRPIDRAGGDEWFLDGTEAFRSRKPRGRYVLRTMAACLVLCILSAAVFPFLTLASVYLDVNPSLSLDVNYRNRVIRVSACNQDGARILGDLDLRGADLDVALYALLGSMVHNGYLTEDTDTILVSVQSRSNHRAAALETKVSGTISANLEEMIHAGQVLSHQVTQEEGQEKAPDSTPGKAAFIEDLLERYPQLQDADLEDLTMDEIVELLEEEDLDFSDYLEDEEDDSDDDEGDEDDSDDDEKPKETKAPEPEDSDDQDDFEEPEDPDDD